MNEQTTWGGTSRRVYDRNYRHSRVAKLMCPCGEKAVKWTIGGAACAECIRKEDVFKWETLDKRLDKKLEHQRRTEDGGPRTEGGGTNEPTKYPGWGSVQWLEERLAGA